jgi:hypothetical protein
MVRIRLPPAVSQDNFRIAPLVRPDLVERTTLVVRADMSGVEDGCLLLRRVRNDIDVTSSGWLRL